MFATVICMSLASKTEKRGRASSLLRSTPGEGGRSHFGSNRAASRTEGVFALPRSHYFLCIFTYLLQLPPFKRNHVCMFVCVALRMGLLGRDRNKPKRLSPQSSSLCLLSGLFSFFFFLVSRLIQSARPVSGLNRLVHSPFARVHLGLPPRSRHSLLFEHQPRLYCFYFYWYLLFVRILFLPSVFLVYSLFP